MTVSKRIGEAQPEGPKLSLVSDLAPLYDLGRKPETTGEKVRRLQAEARILAGEQVQVLENQLRVAIATAEDIAGGGDAYPAGVRDHAQRIAQDLEARVQSMRTIMDRVGEPKL